MFTYDNRGEELRESEGGRPGSLTAPADCVDVKQGYTSVTTVWATADHRRDNTAGEIACALRTGSKLGGGGGGHNGLLTTGCVTGVVSKHCGETWGSQDPSVPAAG